MSIGYYLMEMAMVNSFILYRKSMKCQNLKSISHYNYRLCIIKNLIKPFFYLKEKPDKLLTYDEEKEEFSLVYKRPKPDACQLKLMDKRRFCMNCFVEGQNPVLKFTDYWCLTCETPLCPVDCYDVHRKTKFQKDLDSD